MKLITIYMHNNLTTTSLDHYYPVHDPPSLAGRYHPRPHLPPQEDCRRLGTGPLRAASPGRRLGPCSPLGSLQIKGTKFNTTN